MVSVSVNRVFSLDGGVAIANLSVTASQDIDTEIFKHKVSDRGIDFDAYVAICTPEDLSKLGTTRTGGVSFYRKSSAKIEFSSLTAAFASQSNKSEQPLAGGGGLPHEPQSSKQFGGTMVSTVPTSTILRVLSP